jgi:hypothetical protein
MTIIAWYLVVVLGGHPVGNVPMPSLQACQQIRSLTDHGASRCQARRAGHQDDATGELPLLAAVFCSRKRCE